METQITKIRNESGDNTTDSEEIKKNTGEYYKQLYANKFDNLVEIDKFLETQNPSRLSDEEVESWMDR